MTVLILSQRLDYHGRAVKWGLEQIGVPCDWWDRSLHPVTQAISISFADTRAELGIAGAQVSLERGFYTSIWERRGRVPSASKKLARADKTVALSESRKLLDGIVSIIEERNPTAMLVNAAREHFRAGEKVFQLDVASQVGLKTPLTLVSNDPAAIREFRRSLSGKVVAKQHFPFSWRQSNGDLLLSGTYLLPDEAFEIDEVLSACPMIYQERLDIVDELRVTVFGGTIFTGRQPRSRESARGYSDIRLESRDSMIPAVLATHTKDKLIQLVERLGLLFAAIDIAVCRNGDFVFLECNEAGQFLSYEQFNPNEPMLDSFCQFLAKGDPEFVLEKPSGISLAQFDRSPDGIAFKEEYSRHFREEYEGAPFELADH